MTTYEITNQDLFNAKVDDVDTSDVRGGADAYGNLHFVGDLLIKVISDEGEIESNTISGDFGSGDYEDEFGFKLIAED